MPDLTIRIKKKSDGSAALSCERADGSVTWQRQKGAQGRFFPLHDLTHYAVETVLEHRRGFFGLVAEGWDISDFGTPWPRGPMPADAEPSEYIVGLFDLERAGQPPERSEFDRYGIADEQLARIRGLCQSLFAQWKALSPGDTIALTFTRASSVR